MKQRLLPFFDERRARVEMIVLHATAFEAKKALQIYEKERVSCHYFIGGDGEIYRLVDENKRAWHAGAGRWREFSGDINSRSIGIELANKTLGQNYFSKEQKDALSGLLKDILRRYEIKQVNIVGHSDIAPLRKADPGLAFPWEKLAQHGIGRWYNSHRSSEIKSRDAVSLLKGLGYDTRDEETAIASAYAFRRHYLPEEVKVDPDMQHLLDNVYPKNDKSLLTGTEFISVLGWVGNQTLYRTVKMTRDWLSQGKD